MPPLIKGEIMNKVLLSSRELQSLGIGGQTKIYKLMKEKGFPQPLRYGRHRRWRREDVEKWIEEQNPNQ